MLLALKYLASGVLVQVHLSNGWESWSGGGVEAMKSQPMCSPPARKATLLDTHRFSFPNSPDRASQYQLDIPRECPEAL